ncbi:hypothetical protein Tco_0884441 [Tanacetum coccineum]
MAHASVKITEGKTQLLTGEKITGHSYSQVAQKYKETGEQRFPTEIVNTIGKKHIFQIRYALSTQRGAGAFIANDVLDIQLAIQTEDAGTPPHDLIEEVVRTIVSIIPAKKSNTERVKEHNTSAGTTAEPTSSSAKRSLLLEVSSSAKKDRRLNNSDKLRHDQKCKKMKLSQDMQLIQKLRHDQKRMKKVFEVMSGRNIVTNSRVTPSWREIVSLTFSEAGVLHVNWTSFGHCVSRRGLLC